MRYLLMERHFGIALETMVGQQDWLINKQALARQIKTDTQEQKHTDKTNR